MHCAHAQANLWSFVAKQNRSSFKFSLVFEKTRSKYSLHLAIKGKNNKIK